MQDKICRYLAEGMTYKGTCGMVGISTRAFELWRYKGEQAAQKEDEGGKLAPDEEAHLRLVRAIAVAEARAEHRMTMLVNTQAPNDWRAARWWLETRRKEDYAQKQELDVKHDASANLMQKLREGAREYMKTNGDSGSG